jgi:plastocyanin
MKRRRLFPVCALVLAAALPLAARAATHTITIEGMKFSPETVTVKAGDRIVWNNKDVVPHTATAKGVFDSGNIAPQASWSWKAGAAGRHPYVCLYHPGMKGEVIVK